jgi:hypothetical protein
LGNDLLRQILKFSLHDSLRKIESNRWTMVAHLRSNGRSGVAHKALIEEWAVLSEFLIPA